MMKNRHPVFLRFSLLSIVFAAAASVALSGAETIPSSLPWSQRMALSEMARYPDSLANKPGTKNEWDYSVSFELLAIAKVGDATGNPRYEKFMRGWVDRFVKPDGTIATYHMNKYRLDDVTPGRLLLRLYKRTGEARYKKAAETLRHQLALQPRTAEGGFWHKTIYPHQMWLDGLYMASPFYAEYGKVFHEPADFDDVARQLILAVKNTRDPVTGLLYHGWDESRKQRWSDPVTGDSPNFWGRAVGWYTMAVVDSLDSLPKDSKYRARIIRSFQDVCAALARYQDPKTGLWYQVLDQGDRKGNYLEATCSGMFVYSMAKGVREGYLDPSFLAVARKGYEGILKHLIKVDDHGYLTITHVCAVAGLGGHPYRDGSFNYYVHERRFDNDCKGVAPFILASLEMEAATK